ncbi:penicillin-binding protein activator LpoB [Oceanisphaera pacifica]|uniref:Penicillin-binding protein activator LpoB n=1 Tax=Oceanisphaera pacifica TaxID=2818389 RepID=A0ABS3NGV2_9GAMM|nr:penicillin-binding protein activator LpoB [Oceanisphaera pacifica]MBO1519792.1 penicillin-binding protein activator LpoB [Oceanisphaera pacifica]
MTMFRLTLVLATSVAVAACSMPNPYSSQPAPVKPADPVTPSQPQPPTPPPVIEMPTAPPTPVPDVRNASVERLVDGLANRLKQSAALNEVAGPVLLNPIRNNAGSPVDTQGLTSRLSANLSGQLNFADGATVSRLRQQLAYQGGRADMAALVRLGKQSGADYLLSTELSRSGSTIKLQGQLMELASGELLWSDQVSGR